MSQITTHVLDAALGRPAEGVPVTLSHADGTPIASAVTDADGRVASLGPETLSTGHYRLVFDTAAYFIIEGQAAFYPVVTIDFLLSEADSHYHVPLLLSPFAYSTYRGS